MTNKYNFIPWVKSGIAAAISVNDDLTTALSDQARFPVELTVNESHDITVDLEVYGPSYISGIDSNVIARTDPVNQSVNFEPNYFPSIEFTRADFPWLFTPAIGGQNERLRPWLVLVVVEAQDGVNIHVDELRPQPILRIQGADLIAKELPDLNESWAWAHAQTMTSDKTEIIKSLSPDSPLSVSRLICPIKLKPKTRYYACLVPAFESGRKAGLGISLEDEDRTLKPAWTLGDQIPDEIMLPVYYQWEFSTALGGDFESLVRKLKSRALPPEVGVRDMTADNLGFSIPDAGVLNFPSALKPLGLENNKTLSQDFKNKLRALLDKTTRPLISNTEDPVVGPPIYGRFQANHRGLDDKSNAPLWMKTLNLDPRNRVSAGLGTLVVQDQQESLMASAWDQFSDLDGVVSKLQQTQLAKNVSKSMTHKNTSKMSDADKIQFYTPAFKRMLVNAADFSLKAKNSAPEKVKLVTMQYVVEQSKVATSVTSAPLRKALRPRGPIARRIDSSTISGAQPIVRNRLMMRMGTTVPVTPATTAPSAAMMSGRSTAVFGTAINNNRMSNAPINESPQLDNVDFSANGLISFEQISNQISHVVKTARMKKQKIPPLTKSFVKGARSTIDYMKKSRPKQTMPPIIIWPGFVVFAQQLQQAVNTNTGFNSYTTTIVDIDGSEEQEEIVDLDNSQSIVKHPVFHRPMYEPLKELSQDYILPGVDKIPENTITLLETNPEFIEAYMTGLNHEMSRELLWREYPTDQRGTYFSDFWGRMGNLSEQSESGMDPIHEWDAKTDLGQHFLKNSTDGRLIILIRGELLQRYPDTLIYAISHTDFHDKNNKNPSKLFPVLHGNFEPDVAFFGFNLTEAEAVGDENDPGFYFVIEQPPTETRFGLDVAEKFGSEAEPLSTWNDLSWGHFVNDKESINKLAHLEINKGILGLQDKTIDKATWGFNSAHQAKITLQLPMRIVLHAKLMLAKDEEQ